MADIRTNYPSTSSIAFTITVEGLSSDTNLLAGRESTAVENTNDDLDHLISGVIKLGTSPTVDRTVLVYAYAAHKIVTGTPTYPDVLDGTDSDETLTSDYVKFSMLYPLWGAASDAVTGRDLWMPPTSLVGALGYMPEFYGLFVVHNTGVNLDATPGDHYLHYHRIQAQTV